MKGAMKLRSIILILSILAILSTATGGYLYYASIKRNAIEISGKQAVWHVVHLNSVDEGINGIYAHDENFGSIIFALCLLIGSPSPFCIEWPKWTLFGARKLKRRCGKVKVDTGF